MGKSMCSYWLFDDAFCDSSDRIVLSMSLGKGLHMQLHLRCTRTYQHVLVLHTYVAAEDCTDANMKQNCTSCPLII